MEKSTSFSGSSASDIGPFFTQEIQVAAYFLTPMPPSSRQEAGHSIIGSLCFALAHREFYGDHLDCV